MPAARTAARSRRRSTEDDEREEQRATPPAGEVLDPDPDIPLQMAFFDKLREIPPLDWGHYQAFLYRLEPRVRNAGPSKYIEIFQGPFDETTVKEHHGGGKFQVLLKNTETRVLDAKCTFEIEGAAKLFQSQVVLDERGNEVPVTPPAQKPSINDSTMADVLKQLVSALESKKMPADEAIRSAMETMGQAQKGAMDIVLNAAKAQAGSQTGNALMDKLLERFMERLATEDIRKTNPMSDLKDMLVTMKELRGLTGDDGANGKKTSFLDEARGIAEILKADTDGTLRGVLFGKGDGEEQPVSGWAAAFKFFSSAVERKPEILDYVTRGLGVVVDRLSTPIPGTPQPTTIRGIAPATLQGMRPEATPMQTPASTPAVATAPTQPAAAGEIPQAAIDELLAAIANAYVQGYAGSAAAESLSMLYPTVIEPLKKYLDLPDTLVMMWLRSQRPLQSIASDPEFPDFFTDFKTAILHPELYATEEPGHQDEGVAGSATPPSAIAPTA